MKALVYQETQKCSYIEWPDPIVGENEALIQVKSVGICGSDMHAYLGHDERRTPPLILGHEAAGIVLEGKKQKQRVTINPLVTCGSCRFCYQGRDNLCQLRSIISMNPRQGAFAEYLCIPEENLIPISDKLSFSQAALAEPLACGYRTIQKTSTLRQLPLARVLILGGGAIGVAAALSALLFGAKEIFIAEPNPLRRVELKKIGDFLSFDPNSEDKPEEATMDIVVDAFGSKESRETACAYARAGGIISHIGLATAKDGLDIRKMTLQEIDFLGIYTYTKDNFLLTVEAMEKGYFGKLDWFEESSLSKGQEKFSNLLAKKILKPKVILVN